MTKLGPGSTLYSQVEWAAKLAAERRRARNVRRIELAITQCARAMGSATGWFISAAITYRWWHPLLLELYAHVRIVP